MTATRAEDGPRAVVAATTTAAPSAPPGVADGLMKEAQFDPSGAFSTSVPIRVPEFHGLQPSLALSYNSQADNGIVGKGFAVDGLSFIERSTPGHGVPRVSSSNVYYLDGQELLPCSTLAQPEKSLSCKYAGGLAAYATRTETYRRIAYDASNDAWIIWDQSGTRREYQQRWTTLVGHTYRWLLSSVTDTSGNTVSYHYVTDTGAGGEPLWVYLDTIRYAGERIVIKLYREARPDVIEFGIGDGTRAQGRYRLASIDVTRVERLRTYELSYGTSTTTGASRLESVTEYGSDAELDPSVGRVKAGTAHPPLQVSYVASERTETGGHSQFSIPTAVAGIRHVSTDPMTIFITEHDESSANYSMQHATFDVNGDGRLDHVLVYRYQSSQTCGTAVCPSYLILDQELTGCTNYSICPEAVANSSLRVITFLGQEDGTLRRVPGEYDTGLLQYFPELEIGVADMDGDHRQDLVVFQYRNRQNPWNQSWGSYQPKLWDSDPHADGHYSHTALRFDPTFEAWSGTERDETPGVSESMFPASDGQIEVAVKFRMMTADVTGDGLADFVQLVPHQASGDRTWDIRTYVNQGDARFVPLAVATVQTPWPVTTDSSAGGSDEIVRDVITTGDVDGDGRSDLIVIGKHLVNGASRTKVCVARSRTPNAVSFVTSPYELGCYDTGRPWDESTQFFQAGDLDGDGRTDVLRGYRSGSNLGAEALLSTGTSFRSGGSNVTPALWPGVSQIFVRKTMGDVDGDGRSDLMIVKRSALDTTKTLLTVAKPRPAGPGSDDLVFEGTAMDAGLTWQNQSSCIEGGPYKEYHCIYPTFASLDVGDFDADGRADVGMWNTRYTQVVCPNDTTQYCRKLELVPTLRLSPDNQTTLRWRPLDLDGNGLTDYVAVRPLPTGGLLLSARLRRADGTFDESEAGAFFNDVHGIVAAGVLSVDVDGDGRQDLVYPRYQTDSAGAPATVEMLVMRSLGAGQFEAVRSTSATDVAAFAGQGWMAGDFDGDGDQDLLHATVLPSSGCVDGHVFSLEPYEATGAGSFGSRLGTGVTVCNSAGATPDLTPMDVDRDGRTDLVQVWRRQWLGVSVGTFFAQPGFAFLDSARLVPVADRFGAPASWMPADLDGDGSPDLVSVQNDLSQQDNLEVRLLRSSADGAFQGESSRLAFESADARAWHVGEVDGNGRAGLTHTTYSAGNISLDVLHSTYPGSSGPFALTHSLTAYDGALAAGPWSDMAGVRGELSLGALERVVWDVGASAMRVETILLGGARDLAEVVISPLGATTTVSYDSPRLATELSVPGQGCRLANQAPIATSLTTAPGHGQPSAQATVIYACPGYSVRERRSLGWKKITRTDLAAANRPAVVTRTTNTVDDACGARPLDQLHTDGTSERRTIVAYAPLGTTPPFRCHAELTQENEKDAAGVTAVVATETVVDEFGGVAEVKDFGDLTVSGDERTMVTERRIEPELFIVTEAATSTYAGIGTTGALLAASQSCYDQPLGDGCSHVAVRRGLRTATRVWDDARDGWLDSETLYDEAGNVVATIDPSRVTTRFQYDPVLWLYPILTTDELGHIVTTQWDLVHGTQELVIDPNGAETVTEVDPLGRPALREGPLGDRTSWAYADRLSGGPAVLETRRDGSSSGLWARTELDGLGRVLRVTRKGENRDETQVVSYSDASGRPWRLAHDAFVGDAAVEEELTYDFLGRLTRVVHPDSSVARVHHATGKTTTTDEENHVRVDHLDARGAIVMVEEHTASGTLVTRYQRDALGRIERIVDALGNVSLLGWSSADRLRWEMDPDRGRTDYVYEPAGQLKSRRDARGWSTQMRYDALGRLAERIDDQTGRTVSYQYDEPGHGASLGRLTTVLDSAEPQCPEVSWLGYDPAGQVTEETRCVGGQSYPFARHYDELGRIQSRRYPDGENVSYAYDAAGRVRSMPGFVTNASYDAGGRLVAVDLDNGITERFQYDPSRQWLSSAEFKSSTGALLYSASYDYQLDALVHGATTWSAVPKVVAGVTSTRGEWNAIYGYDALHRLTTVGGHQPEGFGYDAIGNMTFHDGLGAYVYPPSGPTGCGGVPCAGVHAVLEAGGVNYEYDAVGNLTTVHGPAFQRVLDYDVDDHLIAFREEGANGHQEITFDYGWDGERTRKSIAGGETTEYIGGEVEVGGAGLTKYYNFGGRLVGRRAPSGVLSFYHQDRLGSTRFLSDASGAPVPNSDYIYTAYGSVADGQGDLAGDILYTGQRLDDETGYIYLHARYYDPALARFTAADSIVPDPTGPQALNRYSYGYNNPIAYTDPTGHESRLIEWWKETTNSFLYGWADPNGRTAKTAQYPIPVVGAACGALHDLGMSKVELDTHGMTWTYAKHGAMAGGQALLAVWEGASMIGSVVKGAVTGVARAEASETGRAVVHEASEMAGAARSGDLAGEAAHSVAQAHYGDATRADTMNRVLAEADKLKQEVKNQTFPRGPIGPNGVNLRPGRKIDVFDYRAGSPPPTPSKATPSKAGAPTIVDEPQWEIGTKK